MKKISVAILGATGLVGGKAIALLRQFPHLILKEIATSEEHIGKEVYGFKAKRALDLESPYVLSALPKEAAAEIEPSLIARGQHLFSNASTFRMNDNVPLLIPEINLSHLKLIEQQTTSGKLVCNPNCMVALIAPLLAPFIKNISHINIVTMQAISGAGKKYSLSNNIIPNIEGEEEKIEKELRKILVPSECSLAVHVNRVPIQDGHSAILHLHFRTKTSVAELKEAYATQPELYKLYEDPFSPQPGRDLSPLDSQIHIGRIQQRGEVISLFGMTHNLVRGAALGSLLNLNAFLEREWS